MKAGRWEGAHDSLFGWYRFRVVKTTGTCFDCNGRIGNVQLGLEETALEKERGGTTWLIHLDCPGKAVKKKR